MNDNKIPVVFCTDDNYVQYLSVTITSLKYSVGTENTNYSFYVNFDGRKSVCSKIIGR